MRVASVGSASNAEATLVGAPMATTYSGESPLRDRSIRSSAAGLGTGRAASVSHCSDPENTGTFWPAASSTRWISASLLRMPSAGVGARLPANGAAYTASSRTRSGASTTWTRANWSSISLHVSVSSTSRAGTGGTADSSRTRSSSRPWTEVTETTLNSLSFRGVARLGPRPAFGSLHGRRGVNVTAPRRCSASRSDRSASAVISIPSNPGTALVSRSPPAARSSAGIAPAP